MRTLLLATGGTIASKPGADGAVAVALSGADLLEFVPGLDPATVDVVDLRHGPSWNFEPAFVADLAVQARNALASGEAAAVIVTHGTDTIEETAWLTELLAGAATGHGPIVFACAMRNAAEVSADGPRNLLDAFAVANDPAAAGRGVLLCANGALHAARWVTKTNTSALSTFRSPATGPVGSVAAGGVVQFRTRAPEPLADPPDTVDPAVALVFSHGGIDGSIVDWHLDRGAHGIVVVGTGSGNVNGGLVPGIERALASGVPVVVASRCQAGEVAPVYGGPGGGVHLAQLGVIPGGDLGGFKTRLALMVALASDPSVDAVRAWFARLLT